MAVDKKKLFSLFDSVKEERANLKETTIHSHVMLIDGHNTFLRAVHSSPQANDNGEHIGGIIGFLKSIGYGIRMIKPTKVIVVFDGKGGSKRRKSIYPDYKNRSNPKTRVNQAITGMTADEATLSMKKQLVRLTQYLDALPIQMVSVDNIEADDVIAYCATDLIYDKVTIMSADKDFLQLATDKVSIYSPTKKRMYGPDSVKTEYGALPENYFLMRLMDGDPSDCIKGIHGLGEKTILKHFPILQKDTTHTLESLLEYASDNEEEHKVYRQVLENKDLLATNEKLMRLTDGSVVSGTLKMVIKGLWDTIPDPLNKPDFLRMFGEDKISSAFPDVNSWLTQTFTPVNNFILSTNDK
jgi:5'-3' exonuclease